MPLGSANYALTDVRAIVWARPGEHRPDDTRGRRDPSGTRCPPRRIHPRREDQHEHAFGRARGRWAPAVARLVVGGALAMAVTYGIGQLVGAAGI